MLACFSSSLSWITRVGKTLEPGSKLRSPTRRLNAWPGIEDVVGSCGDQEGPIKKGAPPPNNVRAVGGTLGSLQ